MTEITESEPPRRSIAGSDPALVLASFSIIAGVAAATIRIFLIGEIFFTIATVVGALAPVAAAVTIAVALRYSEPRMTAAVWAIPPLIALGVAAQCVGFEAFARRWREADAVPAIETPYLEVITVVSFVVSLVFFAAAIAVTSAVTAAVVALPVTRRLRLVIAFVTSITGCVAVFALTLFPQTLSLGAGIVVIWILLHRMRSRDPVAPASNEPTPRRFILALVGFSIVVIAWAAAAAIGFSNSGHPLATTAMGWGSAAAQIGAIPLVLATIRPASSLRRFTSGKPAHIAVAGISVSIAVQFLFGNPDGVAVFVGAGIAGASLGVWIGLALRSVLPAHPGAVMSVVIAVAILGIAAWFGQVVVSGGLGIAITAVVMALVYRPGRRTALALSGGMGARLMS